jgi:hypothetical protein
VSAKCFSTPRVWQQHMQRRRTDNAMVGIASLHEVIYVE